jgi:hypothetical protein
MKRFFWRNDPSLTGHSRFSIFLIRNQNPGKFARKGHSIMAGSEVARAMRQIDLELEAADRALYGFAITTRHDFINARMQRQGEYLLRLIDAGKHQEALALMNTDDWGDKQQQAPQHRRSKQRKNNKKKGK